MLTIYWVLVYLKGRMKIAGLLVIGLLSISIWLNAQPNAAGQIRKNVPLDSIRLSDPFILADKETNSYYMTGTGGML
jgi:hypothetical protein